MKAGSGRSVALDFFRGLAMLVIVVDHIGGSILSRFTLHAFAFPDAAEAFVFLSGYALAGAWMHWAARAPDYATKRLLRRLWPIYRGFLLCAALMLGCAAVFQALGIEAPNLPVAALGDFTDTPFDYLLDLLLLRHQPYLASVLPMYLIFMAAAPAILPFALKRPLAAVTISAAVWCAAQSLPAWLPAADDDTWQFDPLAWQAMFVIGVVARSHAVQHGFQHARIRGMGLAIAGAVALGCAIWRIWVAPGYLDAALKEHLAIMRIVNFVAIAWICGWIGHAGWIRRAGRHLTWITAVGRQSLPCFIVGAAISLTLDTVLYHATGGLLDYPAGLATDGVALLSMMGFALAWEKALARRQTSRNAPRGRRAAVAHPPPPLQTIGAMRTASTVNPIGTANTIGSSKTTKTQQAAGLTE